MEINYKQFVIVPKKPRMSSGKIASQVAHATYMALKHQGDKKLEEEWVKNGMCVIILQCKNKYDLHGIKQYLDTWGIANHLYIDEGITEVDPLSPTCLATGVLEEDRFWMLKEFKLYK